jgi:hypothetical protein
LSFFFLLSAKALSLFLFAITAVYSVCMLDGPDGGGRSGGTGKN